MDDQKHVAYSIEETQQHKVVIKVGEQRLTPSQISAEVLRKLKQDAETALGRQTITRAIITVPAYFNDAQRQATKEAAKLAGLEVLQLLSEPNAAALAFGLGMEPQTFAVYDLGGGTFDLSLLQLKRGGLFRVVGTKGDTHLGGDDFDQAIVKWLLDSLEREHKLSLSLENDTHLRARLRAIAEAAKITLTTTPTYTVDLSSVLTIEGQRPDLQITLTREKLAKLIQPFIKRTLDICDEALAQAQLMPDAIDQVLLVGGQTRTPFIKAALQEHYGWQVNDTINPDEVVARGAAILGARYCGYLKEQVRLMDVIPLSLGIALNDGSMKHIIKANTYIPTKVPVKNFTTQRDGQELIRFRVYQGERPMASDNVLIGEVILPLTLSRPAGAPHITCTFQVDRDGSLHVYAQDEDTDAEPVKKTFNREYQLSQDEIEAQIREAEAHKEEDTIASRILQFKEHLRSIHAIIEKDHTAPLHECVQELELALEARDIEKAEGLFASIKRQL